MKAASVLLLTLFAAAPVSGASRGEVLEFTADACVYCRRMEPIVARLQREGLAVRPIHVDRNPDAAKQYGVSGLPTFLLVVDGKEVQRLEGAIAESELRSLVAKIPAETRRPATSDSVATRVELGEPSETPPVPRPQSGQGLVAETPVTEASSSDEKSPSIWPFRRKKDKEAPAIRGQSVELGQPAPRSDEAAFAASVRLRIVSGQTAVPGSGTIIASRPGRTLVVTGGTLLANAAQDAKFEVYVSDAATPYFAKVVKADADLDVGLLEFATDAALPAAQVAAVTAAPMVGDRVVSIGATEGREFSREQTRVLAVNKYVGADNLECEGVPTLGRCGGGLFNSRGELVGVCVATGNEGATGLFAGLKAVQSLLASCGAESLFETRAAVATNDSPATTNVDLGSSQPAPAAAMMRNGADDLFASYDETREAAAPVQTAENTGAMARAEAVLGANANGQELIVILPQNSSSGSRVMVIHRPSPKLLSFLNGETDPLNPQPGVRTAESQRRVSNLSGTRMSESLQASAIR